MQRRSSQEEFCWPKPATHAPWQPKAPTSPPNPGRVSCSGSVPLGKRGLVRSLALVYVSFDIFAGSKYSLHGTLAKLVSQNVSLLEWICWIFFAPLVNSRLMSFHLLKNICHFPLLVLKGIYDYWMVVLFYFFFFRGLNQMAVKRNWLRFLRFGRLKEYPQPPQGRQDLGNPPPAPDESGPGLCGLSAPGPLSGWDCHRKVRGSCASYFPGLQRARINQRGMLWGGAALRGGRCSLPACQPRFFWNGNL